jgi:hypothetical protein
VAPVNQLAERGLSIRLAPTLRFDAQLSARHGEAPLSPVITLHLYLASKSSETIAVRASLTDSEQAKPVPFAH